jgi:hypothetical protein
MSHSIHIIVAYAESSIQCDTVKGRNRSPYPEPPHTSAITAESVYVLSGHTCTVLMHYEWRVGLYGIYGIKLLEG